MTNKPIYTRNCYTYLIGWSKHNVWYYGRRTAIKCDPTDLWVKYFTSSKHVSKFRIEHGEPDVVQIRKVFGDNFHKCTLWETRVLTSLNAAKSEKWLNKTNGDLKWDTTGIIFSEEINIKKGNSSRGKPKSEEHKHKIGLSNLGKKKPHSKVSTENRKRTVSNMTPEERSKKFGNNMTIERRQLISKGSSKCDYVFTKPNGETFIHHSIIVVARQYGLAGNKLYSNVDKGPIKPVKYGITSDIQLRTIGWSVSTLNNAA